MRWIRSRMMVWHQGRSRPRARSSQTAPSAFSGALASTALKAARQSGSFGSRGGGPSKGPTGASARTGAFQDGSYSLATAIWLADDMRTHYGRIDPPLAPLQMRDFAPRAPGSTVKQL